MCECHLADILSNTCTFINARTDKTCYNATESKSKCKPYVIDNSHFGINDQKNNEESNLYGIDKSSPSHVNSNPSKDITARKLSINSCNRGLNVTCLNIQHLIPKIDEIKHILTGDSGPDVLGLCETFLHEQIPDNIIVVNNFNIERKDRTGKRGGGILVYISNSLTYFRRKDLENKDVESICIEVKLYNSKPFLIHFFYRPPSSKQCWINNFETIVDNMDSLNIDMIILGDFNINFTNNKSPHYSNSRWAETISKFGLFQHVIQPTRVSKNSSSILDHIYTNCPETISNVMVSNICMSDHFPICFTYSLKLYKSMTSDHKVIRYRCFKRFEVNSFKEDLRNVNINLVETCPTPNDSLQYFYNVLNRVLNKHAPMKEKRVKRDHQPKWFDSEVKEAIHKRDQFHKNKQFNEYKVQRNKITAMIRKKKRNFYNDAIKKNTKPTFLWKSLKSLSHQNVKTTQLCPKSLLYNGKTLHERQTILNSLK